MCVCAREILTYIVQVESQVLVLEEGVVVETAPLDLLEEGADIPAVEYLQQHDAGDTQPHVQHRFQLVLQCHGPDTARYNLLRLDKGGDKE